MSEPAGRFEGLLTVRAAIAPLLGEPRISRALTSQLLAGEQVEIVEHRDDWLRVRSFDGYEGWTHQGFLGPSRGDEPEWKWSLGCRVTDHSGCIRALPLGARVAPEVTVVEGEAVAAAMRAERFPSDANEVAASAASLFNGASYLWGGVTPWGVDCSGLVQRVVLLHGLVLPRDAWQQVEAASPVSSELADDQMAADLLFFSDRQDRRVTHVGMALGNGRMVHSALMRGGVTLETLSAIEDYVVRLRSQCVGVYRLHW